jgi:formate dehydrogenase subunit gamma
MTSVFKPWDTTRGAEIIAEHARIEGATLVILHALQEAFVYVPEDADGRRRAQPVARGSP